MSEYQTTPPGLRDNMSRKTANEQGESKKV